MMLLKEIKSVPILLDASVLLVGVDKDDNSFSFKSMKELYIAELFNYFDRILIHDTVLEELDSVRKDFIGLYLGKNVEIVSEEDMYGNDPLYTTIFNEVANFDLFKYQRLQKKDKGDVFSLAYAAYHNIPFISARDGSVIKAVEEMSSLKNVEICGFEHLLLLGYLNNTPDKELAKRYKSIYKSHCTPAIKLGKIPKTFSEFIRENLKGI